MVAMTTARGAGRVCRCGDHYHSLGLARMAQQEGQRYSSLMLNYLVFASIGVLCSLLLNSYYGTSDIVQHHNLLSTLTINSEYSLDRVKEVLRATDCVEVEREAKVSDDIKYFMASKLRYQFDSTVEDASSIGQCRAMKVVSLAKAVLCANQSELVSLPLLPRPGHMHHVL